jgi:hypothetical protein
VYAWVCVSKWVGLWVGEGASLNGCVCMGVGGYMYVCI